MKLTKSEFKELIKESYNEILNEKEEWTIGIDFDFPINISSNFSVKSFDVNFLIHLDELGTFKINKLSINYDHIEKNNNILFFNLFGSSNLPKITHSMLDKKILQKINEKVKPFLEKQFPEAKFISDIKYINIYSIINISQPKGGWGFLIKYKLK